MVALGRSMAGGASRVKGTLYSRLLTPVTHPEASMGDSELWRVQTPWRVIHGLEDNECYP